jgi:hypothetical protein
LLGWVFSKRLLHSKGPNEVEFIPENPLGNKIELFSVSQVEKSFGLLSAPRSSSIKGRKQWRNFSDHQFPSLVAVSVKQWCGSIWAAPPSFASP